MCDDTYVPLQKLGRNVEKDPLGIDSRVALQISVEKLGPCHIVWQGRSESLLEHAVLQLMK